MTKARSRALRDKSDNLMQYRFVSANPALLHFVRDDFCAKHTCCAALFLCIGKCCKSYSFLTQVISVTSLNSGLILWLCLKCRINLNWSDIPFAHFLVILSHSIPGKRLKGTLHLALEQPGSWEEGGSKEGSTCSGSEAPPEYFGMVNFLFKLKRKK